MLIGSQVTGLFDSATVSVPDSSARAVRIQEDDKYGGRGGMQGRAACQGGSHLASPIKTKSDATSPARHCDWRVVSAIRPPVGGICFAHYRASPVAGFSNNGRLKFGLVA
jgi:hypothetical protein